WYSESRPDFAEPPAESPSTMNTSLRDGSLERQSESLPGRPPRSPADLRRTRSRARRAARRAWDEEIALLMIVFASVGLRSSQSISHSLQVRWTNDLASVLPSLVLVWPSNWGSLSLSDTIAARPSRTSSPVSAESLSLSSFLSRA